MYIETSPARVVYIPLIKEGERIPFYYPKARSGRLSQTYGLEY